MRPARGGVRRVRIDGGSTNRPDRRGVAVDNGIPPDVHVTPLDMVDSGPANNQTSD